MRSLISKMTLPVFALALGLLATQLWGGQADGAQPACAAQTATRRALLVGISNYDAGTKPGDGWHSLNTAPDLEHMSYVLDKYYDFKAPASMKVLREEQATQEGIVAAFKDYLIKPAKPGDTVVFYYTGHGFHVPDVSGDEKTDHEDEVTVSWVPKDKQGLPDDKRRAMMYMLDDTYEVLLRELAQNMRGPDGKVKGSITVIFDSCNSGSGAKAVLVPKGREWDEKIDGPRPPAAKPDPASGWLTLGANQLEGAAFISGSRSNQFSYMMPDSENDGSILTYHIAKYLTSIAVKKQSRPATYGDMYDSISAEIYGYGKAQDPQIEGNIDSQIFGNGEPVSMESLPTVTQVAAGATPRLRLNVGALHGYAKGTRFDIYKASSDVKNPSNKLAELVLDEVKSTFSFGNVSKPAQPATQPSDYQAAQAVTTAFHFDGQPLKVFIQKAAATETARGNALADAVKTQAFVTRDGVSETKFDAKLGWCKANDKGWCADKKDEYFYQRSDGKSFSLGKTLDAAALQKRLLSAWRWRHFANLSLTAASPVTLNMVALDGSPLKNEGGRIILKPGDTTKLTVTNNSGGPVFVTVIYLKDNGEISVWPGKKVVRGQQQLSTLGTPVDVLKLSNITAPNGDEVEIFKLIATPNPEDFTGISFGEEERKGMKGLEKNPLQDLLFGFVDGKAKGGDVESVEIDDWYTAQVTYVIKSDKP